MKKLLLALAFAMVMGISVNGALAVTAYPYPIKFTQPDKSTVVTLTMKGDEKVHWAETEDGYSLLYNSDGYFCYAFLDENGNMQPSRYIATEISARTPEVVAFLEKTPKKLRYSAAQINELVSLWNFVDEQVGKSLINRKNRNTDKSNSDGAVVDTLRLPVILMSFRDRAIIKDTADFKNLLNQTAAGNSSVADYYSENSYGQLKLEFKVVGPYVTSRNLSYYGSNSNGHYQDFAREAATAAAADLDYSQFDFDEDGYVDGIHIFFAGFGEEAGGGADCIWSHRSSIYSQRLVCNGKVISSYSCSPELSGSSGTTITNVGVICHELGHVFGAPDYYDTDYGTNGEYPGNGQWDIMSSGSWNNSGRTPAHHNPYTKCNIYGWSEIRELRTPQAVVMMNVENDKNSYYCFKTTTTNEYYILEYRHKTGFDARIPGSGMVIYHVHKSFSPSSQTNNASHPQKFYVVASNASVAIPTSMANSYGNVNMASAAWGSNKTEFTDDTRPSAKSWAGANTGKPVTDMVMASRNKSLSFLFCGAQPNPSDVEAVAASASEIKITWRPFAYNKTLLLYSPTGNFTTPQAGGVYNAGDVLPDGCVVLYNGSSSYYKHTGLTPETTYRYKAFNWINNEWTSGIETSATTFHSAYPIPFIEYFDADTTMPAYWNAEYDDDDYSWQIGHGGLQGSYAPHSGNNNYFIKASSASVNGYEATLITAPVNTSTAANSVLKFWYLSPKRLSDVDELIVKVRENASSEWVELEKIHTSVTSWRELKYDMPKSNFCQVAFTAKSFFGKGIAIDDIVIEEGRASSIETADVPELSTKIFPNPASEHVTIAVSDNENDVSYQIYDIVGHVVAQGIIKPQEEASFAVKHWKKGIYVVKLSSGNAEKVQQLIVK